MLSADFHQTSSITVKPVSLSYSLLWVCSSSLLSMYSSAATFSLPSAANTKLDDILTKYLIDIAAPNRADGKTKKTSANFQQQSTNGGQICVTHMQQLGLLHPVRDINSLSLMVAPLSSLTHTRIKRGLALVNLRVLFN